MKMPITTDPYEIEYYCDWRIRPFRKLVKVVHPRQVFWEIRAR